MKKIILGFVFLFLIFSTLQVLAQVNQQWVGRYNGPGNSHDDASKIAIDNSGNVYVVGSSYGSSSRSDICTIKYNSSGVQQWVATYNGPINYDDAGTDIVVDATGNVYVCGYSSRVMLGDNDIVTIKYNSLGGTSWVQRFNTTGNLNDVAYGIALDNFGNVCVTGFGWGSSTNEDFCTLKYSSGGSLLWTARYNGPTNGFEEAYGMTTDGSGYIYITGPSQGIGTGYDYCTIKYNSSGDSVWTRRYNGPTNSSDGSYSIAVDSSGSVYVSGSSPGIGTFSDYCTLKYNSSGVQQWEARYNGPSNDDDAARILTIDNSNNIYVTGFSRSGTGPGTEDMLTVKYNSNGIQQWAARYNGAGNNSDGGNSVAVDTSRNVYVTGYTRLSSSQSSQNYVTIKYNSSGAQQWAMLYNGTGNNEDDAEDVKTDNQGNIYVTGSSAGSGLNRDITTIKYSQIVGIEQISSEIPNEFSLSQNYPNPFNPTTKINYSIPNTQYLILKIYDILGNEVATLVNEKQNPGNYEVEFDARLNGQGSNLSSGIYYYKLVTDNFSETKKMILLK